MNENNCVSKDINICFLGGKIVSPPDFNFFYNNKKYISKISFFIKTECGFISSNKNKQQCIEVIAYNDMADLIYRNFKIGDLIQFRGYLVKNCICLQYLFS